MRTCTKCGVEKEEQDFVKGSNWRRCRTCEREYARIWHNGSKEKAEAVAEDRAFRKKMYAEGFSHCAECVKWYPKERFSLDSRRTSKCYPYCKDCQHQQKNDRDHAERPVEVNEMRDRATALFDANKRECPLCGKVYDLPPPKTMRGTSPRWWAAWKACTGCRRLKQQGQRAAGIGKSDNAWKKKDAVKRMYHQSKARQGNNKGKVIDFNLTLEYMRGLWWEHQGRCAISGTPFDTTFAKEKNPLSPSMDRIDSTKGYEPGNVRFVCWGINAALNHWGEETYFTLAKRALGRN